MDYMLLNFTAVVFGLSIGSAFPFTLLYIVINLKRHSLDSFAVSHFVRNLLRIPSFILGIVVFALLFLKLAGVDISVFELETFPPEFFHYLGYAVCIGFLTGLFVFIAGAIGSKRHKVNQR